MLHALSNVVFCCAVSSGQAEHQLRSQMLPPKLASVAAAALPCEAAGPTWRLMFASKVAEPGDR